VLLNLQLVFDCADPDEIMRFWGRALGYRNQFSAMTPAELTEWRKGFPQFDGRGRIDDEDGRRMSVYIQKVPEPKSGRNRLRPEVAGADEDRLQTLGATRDGDEWTDVEGNEFTTVDDGELRMRTILVDAIDPARMLEFWSAATGYVVSGDRCDPPEGDTYVLPLSDGTPRELDLAPGLRFVASSAPKRFKNRLHLDLQARNAEKTRDELVALGATVLQWDSEHVLADPEGNELCVNSPSA
jgi:hypothetical protein